MAASILGKAVSKMVAKDKVGNVKQAAKEYEIMQQMVRKKESELKDIAASGSSLEKYWAKSELDRRSGNKTTAKDLKKRQAEGKLTEKQVRNRMDANKDRPMSSDSIRDSIMKEVDRERYAKGGMVKKANCGASVPASKGKK